MMNTTDQIARAMAMDAKATADSKADLVGGKVPASQLPSYVDDVAEGYMYQGRFYSDAQHTQEITGEEGKIYLDLATNTTYRWSGNSFIPITGQADWNQTNTNAPDYIKNKPALGTASALNVAASGNASATEVVKGDDTRLADTKLYVDDSGYIAVEYGNEN